MSAELQHDIYQAYNELLQHFEDITRLVSDLIWDLDQDLRIRTVSARLREITGFLPHEWVGKTLEEVGKFANSSEESVSVRNWRKPFRDQVFVVHGRDGDTFTFLLSGTPYFHVKSGEFEGVHGVARDITQTLKSEEELRRSTEMAENSNRAKTEFLASMSHELRTPLNGILGFAQLLQLNPQTPLTDTQNSYTASIMNSGAHLLDLIDQVLELSRIESGNYTMDIVDVPVGALLDECLSIIDTIAAKRNITLSKVVTKCDELLVRADRVRFKQVLLNLLSNAVKYNCENGRVSVSMHTVDDAIIHVEIADTGVGIDAEKLAHLFEPFERLGFENSEIEGTGIGLTITRELLRIMGGDVGVISHVDKGSMFWVELPLSQTDVETAQEGPGQAVDHAELSTEIVGSRTILYVEDNPSNMSLMKHILSMVPEYTMIEAHNGEIGIAVAEKELPDLILMDINLPGMDGRAAMKQLATMDKTKHIPVVAVSANAMPRDIAQALEAGFHGYLTKPFQLDQLFEILKKIFSETAHATPGDDA